MNADEEFERLVAPIREELSTARVGRVLKRSALVWTTGTAATIAVGLWMPAAGAALFLATVIAVERVSRA